MTRRLIQPTDFAALLWSAQLYRSQVIEEPVSKVEAAYRACDDYGISRDWCAPLIAFLNDSPSAAEAWTRRIHDEALDRMATRLEEENNK